MSRSVEEEFTEFVRQRGHVLIRSAFVLCGNQHDAEDLAQGALAKAYVHWRRIESAPEAYVRRIMFRDFLSRWRWRRRRPEMPVADVPERPAAGAWAADPATTAPDRMALAEALRGLPPRQRAVLVLRYLEDMSERAVAETLGCSTGTVASQASRALARLRTRPDVAPAPAATGGIPTVHAATGGIPTVHAASGGGMTMTRVATGSVVNR